MRWFLILALLFAGPAYAAYSPDAVNVTDNNTTLRNIPSTAVQYVQRSGFATPGDAGEPLLFKSSNVACSLNSGNGDGGSQVKSLDGKCWLAQWPNSGMDPRQFGIPNDGTGSQTTNLAILQAVRDAAIANPKTIKFSQGLYAVSGTIDFKRTVVEGDVMPIMNPFPQGPTIQCPAAIAAPCVVVGEPTPANLGGSFQKMMVTFSGTPIAGDVGIQYTALDSKCDDVVAYNVWDGIKFTNGISAHCWRQRVFKFYNAALVQDGFPEVYITSFRAGTAGCADVHGHTYILVTGNDPNGLQVENSQFNTGCAIQVDHFLRFENVTSQVNGLYKFTNVHAEAINNFGISSDGSGGCYQCWFNNVDLDATMSTTGISQMFDPAIPMMTRSIFSNMNLAFNNGVALPNKQYDFVHFSNIHLTVGDFTINGSKNLTVDGVEAVEAINVGGTWDNLQISNLIAPGYADNAEGRVVASNVPVAGYVPVLVFGSGNTGMVIASKQGGWWRNPDGTASLYYALTLSAKGTSTGTAQIVGPFFCKTDGFGGQGTPAIMITSSPMTGLTGRPITAIGQGSNTALMYDNGSSSAVITDASFTNTTSIAAIATCVPK